MKISSIQFEYSHTKQVLLESRVLYKNVGVLNFRVLSSIVGTKVTYNIINHLSEPYRVLRQLLIAQSEILADIDSWRLGIPLKLKRTAPNVAFSVVQPPPSQEFSSFCKRCLGVESPTERQLEILSAYRKIKSEPNSALQYLMFFRMLEVFSREKGLKLQTMLNAEKASFWTMSRTRSPGELESIIIRFRNKIHATTAGYQFPYRTLEKFCPLIDRTVRKIIKNEFNGATF